MAGKFEIRNSENGKFHFHLNAANGEKILSSEIYESKANAQNGAESVKRNAADDNRFERKTSASGESYFVLKSTNGEVVGTSETYSSSAALENGIASVKNNAPSAEIVDSTNA